jgi:hypothetical protein
MLSREITLDSHPASSPPAKRTYAVSGLDRLALIPIIVGLLAAVSILLLIYQENRAFQYRIEAAEVWSAYQLKIVQATIEEDPNLKAQYTEEQDVLRRHAQDLKEKSSGAGHAVVISIYAALLLLLGAAGGVFALFTNSIHSSYASLLLGIIGVALCLRALF